MKPTNPILIRPLRSADRAAWERLARGYKRFYRTDHEPAVYEASWQRLLAGQEVTGLAACLEGEVLGIAHYLFHTSIWTGEACYLQDLFVDEAQRGRGLARALIQAVAQAARERGCSRYYWTTHVENQRARALYDQVAEHRGMIRYDLSL